MKTAYAMPCTTPEQAEEMKKLCEKHGIKIWSKYDKNHSVLTNSYADSIGLVGFTTMENCNAEGRNPTRTLIPYNPALFLYSLGVFPEKWCVRDTEEANEFLRKLNTTKVIDSILYNFNHSCNGKKYVFLKDKDSNLICRESIPTDYIEVTLEELMFHYEKPKKTKHTWINMGGATEQPKWEDRTTGGHPVNILREDRGDGVMNTEVYKCGIWVQTQHEKSGKYLGHYFKHYDSTLDLIPFHPRKSELLAEKEKLQKRVAEIDKELNN